MAGGQRGSSGSDCGGLWLTRLWDEALWNKDHGVLDGNQC